VTLNPIVLADFKFANVQYFAMFNNVEHRKILNPQLPSPRKTRHAKLASFIDHLSEPACSTGWSDPYA